ncbi:hypothetical protein HG536_0F02370 [Torulaspora globosa]|uniref:DUF1776-domain-containing protein n=1 Tax=Torulaspora globosa TaxID=48254 RepID=A0A7G3ZK76_9SACH|nr:uncharacterized protein HG536_0F02370 [Torulaspora globosa]QLL33912.1 hypothetical protein HG536_0F02370 [Torulaspora globosa]
MSSRDQDFVDGLFSAGHSLFSKGSRVMYAVAERVASKVREVQDREGGDLSALKADSGAIGRWSYVKQVFLSARGQQKRAIFGLGVAAGALVLFWQARALWSVPPRLAASQAKCVLVFGDMRDPIVRSQVMDLYRRGFMVFLCSTNAKAFRERQEDDDFLRHIDPHSASDLASFIQFLEKTSDVQCQLASILFMPNLAYYPPGEVPLSRLECELRSNVLVYYNALLEVVRRIQGPAIQVILFNPSLSFNLAVSQHPAELFVSALMTGVHQSLKRHHRLNAYMIHVGALKLGAQPSNYKYLGFNGSNINEELLRPVYNLIMTHSGNIIQRSWLWLTTLGSLRCDYYYGKYSRLSTIPFISRFINGRPWSSATGPRDSAAAFR